MRDAKKLDDRSVWFYRDFQQFSGGHLKHAHYFNHTQSCEGFESKICFQHHLQQSIELIEQRNALWGSRSVEKWVPENNDLLFAAGMDWRYLDQLGLGTSPFQILNLIQHVRHSKKDTELYAYLKRRALRICVSQEVADAIHETGKVNGPITVIPNGVDLEPVSSSQVINKTLTAPNDRILIIGYKNPAFARQLAQTLDQHNIQYQLNLELCKRKNFIEQLELYDTVLCLPNPEEGFYLPALEAMARGKLTITMDCIGNRGFCLAERNCLIADYTLESALHKIKHALLLETHQREIMLLNAIETAGAFSMQQEVDSYHQVLQNLAGFE